MMRPSRKSNSSPRGWDPVRRCRLLSDVVSSASASKPSRSTLTANE